MLENTELIYLLTVQRNKGAAYAPGTKGAAYLVLTPYTESFKIMKASHEHPIRDSYSYSGMH
jgi:hypothetical protein